VEKLFSEAICISALYYIRWQHSCWRGFEISDHFSFVTSTKEVMFLPDFVCLLVCLLAR